MEGRMSRKTISRKHPKKGRDAKEWPLVVYLWIIGLAILGYIVARIGFYNSPHPIHWLSGLAGAIIGIGIGWFWYHWKGDIV